MREVTLRVPAASVEAAMDRLLPVAPYGILERPEGDEVELRIRGAQHELPSVAELSAMVGDALHDVDEGEISDDWRQRRLLDYEPLVIGHVGVRRSWAPVVEGVLDVIIDEGDAFGTGAHPTTRACLELLGELEPRGALADLGCGSGILAVAAARLGWAPVLALDARATAVQATLDAAAVNGVEIDVHRADLLTTAPPDAATVCANVPPEVHAAVAAGLAKPPAALIASGFVAGEAEAVLASYAPAGLVLQRTIETGEWSSCLLRGVAERPPSALRCQS